MAYPVQIGAKQLAQAIAMDAAGVHRCDIAAELGVTGAAITKHLNKDETAALIAASQARILEEALSTAIDNQISKIKIGKVLVKNRLEEGYDKGSREDITDRGQWLNLAERAENKLLESVGIHASHAQSIQIANILNVSGADMPDEIRDLIQAVRGRETVLEAEFADEE